MQSRDTIALVLYTPHPIVLALSEDMDLTLGGSILPIQARNGEDSDGEPDEDPDVESGSDSEDSA